MMKSLATACLLGLLASENLYRLQFYNSSYERTTENILKHIPEGSTVLASETYWLGLKDHIEFRGLLPFLYERMFKNRGMFPDYKAKLDADYIVADEELYMFFKDRGEEIRKLYIGIEIIEDDFYGSSNYLSKKSPRPMKIYIYKRR